MNSFYTNTLYPLQDQVLTTGQSISTPFYLTGGTALSRGYFNHRYSDDLDFFVNRHPNFIALAQNFLDNLSPFNTQVITKSDTYYSAKVNDILKIDFINDSGQHYGDLVQTNPLFPRLDNLQNILANKITAILGRDEPKDVVDVWIITLNVSIDWQNIFTAANSKAVGIFPPNIAQRLSEFPPSLLEKIKWVENQKPSPQQFTSHLQQIVNHILKIC